MILLIRVLPFLTAILQAVVFTSQLRNPQTYPYLVLLGIFAVPVASVVIGWKRIGWGDLFDKMVPTFVLLLALGFGLILTEGQWPGFIITALATIATLISLELLFLLAYNPASYPVSGLSRMNIAYVPIAVWYALATSSGFMVFIHSSPVWHVGIAGFLGAIFFYTTGHHDASRVQKVTWSLIGLFLGLQVGWIGLLLPVSMNMQGFLAALLFTAVMRVRRYIYEPRPPLRLAMSEAIGVSALFLISLLTAKWI